MEELIKATVNQNNQQVVSARDLYKGLDIKRKFSLWVDDNFNGFIEDEDFEGVLTRTPYNPKYPNGKQQEIQDYAVTISMAKELCMMSHSERGKAYRHYLIELERKWNNPAEIVKRGYAILQDENSRLKIENIQMQPKALFADAVSASHTSILVGDLAKMIKQNGVDIGARRLFNWLREHHYLISRKGADYNSPTQYSMERELFEIKESTHINSDGVTVTTKTPKVTGKGQQYFINKFLNDQSA